MSTLAQRRQHSVAALPAQAAARYRTLEIGSRLDAASPHALVGMLFGGLREALAQAQRDSAGSGGGARTGVQCVAVTRAIAIVDALAGSLDFIRGGDVARALAAAYADIRMVIVAAQVQVRADLFADAAVQVATLHDGWNAIADQVNRASRAGS